MSRERILIEVAIESVADALAAAAGGADRLELCAALDLGGLTPTLGLFQEVRDAVPVPIFVMIRPRDADFVYTADELKVMQRDLDHLLRLRPDGFVFGALKPDGTVDRDATGSLVRAASGLPCVFHRAFDRTPDAHEALEACVQLGIRRILTSGREERGLAGAIEIAARQIQAAGRIEILPCGKVRSDHVGELLRLTGCLQVHGSFAEKIPDNAHRGFRGYRSRSRTSQREVAAMRKVLGQYIADGALGPQ